MKLYKALCITGAVTILILIAAFALNMVKSTADTFLGKASVVTAFVFAAVFTVMLVMVFIKLLKNKRM